MAHQLYDIPDWQRVCRAFASAALQTWSDLQDFADLGEESITDYRLLQLKRMCPEEVRVIKFKKPRESVTGADWEWWFGSGGLWFGMRVQAKRLDTAKLQYAHLAHKVGSTAELQVDRLVNDARSRDLYAMYCFYNYWTPESASIAWTCFSFEPHPQLWGTSIADATQVKGLISSKRLHLADVAPISKPLMCLACCTGYDRMGPMTLPYRARSIAVALADDPQAVPPLVDQLPQYVPRDDDAGASRVTPANLDLDGILVVQEQPDVYAQRAFMR